MLLAGDEMVSAVSRMALGESGSLQCTEVLECRSTSSGKFCHLWTEGLGPCLAQRVSRDWAAPEGFHPTGAGGGQGIQFPFLQNPCTPPPSPPTLGTGLLQISWGQSCALG